MNRMFIRTLVAVIALAALSLGIAPMNQTAGAAGSTIEIIGDSERPLANEVLQFDVVPSPLKAEEVAPVVSFVNGKPSIDFDSAWIVTNGRGLEFYVQLHKGLYFAALSGDSITTGLVGATHDGWLEEPFVVLVSRHPINSMPMPAYTQETSSPLLNRISKACIPPVCTGGQLEFVLYHVRAVIDPGTEYSVKLYSKIAFLYNEGGEWIYGLGNSDEPYTRSGVTWFVQDHTA